MPDIPYTVRLAPDLLERIEKTAHERGISPRKLIRAVLAERFANGSDLQQHGSASQSNQQGGLRPLTGSLQSRVALAPRKRPPSARFAS